MSDYKETAQEGLVSSGSRGLATKPSMLVRRGLDLIASRQPRVIQFPNDKSLGILYIRDLNSYDEDAWEEFIEACGIVTVAPEKALKLKLNYETEADLSALQNLKPDDLYGLSIGWDTEDNAYLKYILGLTKIKSLDLNNYQPVSNEDIIFLQEFRDLEFLCLFGSVIDDKGLKSLLGLTKLRELHLDFTSITSFGLTLLSELRNINYLTLSLTNIDDDGIKNLANLTSMKWLALSDTKITDCGLKYLVELRDLQTLLLSDTQITDAGIKHLKELKNLTSLDLDCTEISDGGLIELQNALPYCKIKGNQPYGMERLRKNQLSRRDKENKQQITREEAIQELRRRHKERQCL